ncbi:MAG TPA: alpha/beta hydrolase [Accumulibacter sp.]|nr:alpha/beta hydrolase [Accumulibacter sp.]
MAVQLRRLGFRDHTGEGGYRNIGDAGHINVDSGYGPWPEGLAFFGAAPESTGARGANAVGTATRAG